MKSESKGTAAVEAEERDVAVFEHGGLIDIGKSDAELSREIDKLRGHREATDNEEETKKTIVVRGEALVVLEQLATGPDGKIKLRLMSKFANNLILKGYRKYMEETRDAGKDAVRLSG